MRTIRPTLYENAVVFAIGLSISATCAGASRPSLSGRVHLEDGSPATNATVFVYTAGPKTGSGVVCPSCYPDCAKKAKTTAQGEFTISSLDPDLIFRLLVIAAGCESKFVSKTDPAQGEKRIMLQRLSEAKLKSRTRICGVVIDEAGKPLAGATVGPEGVAYEGITSWGGTDRFVDPLAVTDDQGKFWLFCGDRAERVYAVVEARGVAKRWVDLKPGRDHFVRMQEGVTVTGTLRHNGRPGQDVVLGLVTKERGAGSYLRCDELATGTNGAFLLPNVPANKEFVLYAKMETLRDDGSFGPMTFMTGTTGTRQDLGQLEIKPGYHVAGRVTLSDGRPLPAKTRLSLSREEAWDHQEGILDEAGHFDFRGVPAEAVGLSVRVPGYKLSKRNASLDWLNGGMVGRVDRDITDLNLLLEPGEWRYNGEEGEPPNGESQPRDKPLRGAKP